jgi:hypothetical protein
MKVQIHNKARSLQTVLLVDRTQMSQEQRKRKRDDHEDNEISDSDGNKRLRLVKEHDELLQLVVQKINEVLHGGALHFNDTLTWLQNQRESIIQILHGDLESAQSVIRIITSSLSNWVQTHLQVRTQDEDEQDEAERDDSLVEREEEVVLFVLRLLSSLVVASPSPESEEEVSTCMISILTKIYGETRAVGRTKRLGRQILRSLIEIASQEDNKVSRASRMISEIMNNTALWKHLFSDWDPNVRFMALNLLVRTSDPTDQVREICCRHMHDRDARVRTEAVRCLHLWFRARATLNQDPIEEEREANQVAKPVYGEVVIALRDDYADVKTEAMDLLCALANRYPRFRQSGLSIVEDAFVRLCSMVRDTIVAVRSKACGLLGRLERSDLIAANVLLETFNQISLDYQPHYIKQQSRGGTDIRLVPERGQTTEVTEDEDDSRLYADAIGTFVLGLEDEFKQVRMACIDSIGQLSARSTEFALRSMRFLLEAFNDEIDEVRIASIRCLTWIARQAVGAVQLDHAQLQIVLVLVGDRNRGIRFAVHELLSHAILSGGHVSLASAVKALAVNEMRKYGEGTPSASRQERESVYRCLASMGCNHPELSELLVEELLNIKPHLMSAEQSLDEENDPYMGALILLFNAATKNECIISLMPDHIRRKHLDQARNKWPQFFPDGIRVLNVGRHFATTTFEEAHTVTTHTHEHDDEQARKRLLNGFEQVKRLARCGELRSANATLRALRAELSQIASHSPITAFASLYIQMCHLYLGMLTGATNGRHRTVHRDLLRIIRKVSVIYLPKQESDESIPLRKQLELVRAMVLAHRAKSNPHDMTIQQLVVHSMQELSLTTTDPREHFPSLVLPPASMLTSVPKYSIFSPQPVGVDKSLTFPSYVPLSLHVECIVDHPDQSRDQHVHLLVQYPDGSHSLFPLDSQERIVQTDVHVDMEAWTEPAPLTLSMVLLSRDTEQIGRCVGDDALESRFVLVSKDVQVYVHPYQK